MRDQEEHEVRLATQGERIQPIFRENRYGGPRIKIGAQWLYTVDRNLAQSEYHDLLGTCCNFDKTYLSVAKISISHLL